MGEPTRRTAQTDAAQANVHLLDLCWRAASAVAVSAELAQSDAERAVLVGDITRAHALRERAEHARQAAERGRRAARRLHVRRQAAALLAPPRRWGVLLSACRGAAAAHAGAALPVLGPAVI